MFVSKKLSAYALLLLSTSVFSGCSTTETNKENKSLFANISSKKNSAPTNTGSIPSRALPSVNSSNSNIVYWAEQWKKNPQNAQAALAYAQTLQSIGSTQQALSVLQTTAYKSTGSQKIWHEYGKLLRNVGKGDEAKQALTRAASLPPANWKIYSLLGTIYDNEGNHQQAQQQYQAALRVSPYNSTVLNNLAMSYVLNGKLQTAEAVLRDAIMVPGQIKSPKITQNLALVVGLQGRFAEAEKIASQNLPPDKVKENIEYLRAMLKKSKQLSNTSNKHTKETNSEGLRIKGL